MTIKEFFTAHAVNAARDIGGTNGTLGRFDKAAHLHGATVGLDLHVGALDVGIAKQGCLDLRTDRSVCHRDSMCR